MKKNQYVVDFWRLLVDMGDAVHTGIDWVADKLRDLVRWNPVDFSPL
jgi:hypothetical protein